MLTGQNPDGLFVCVLVRLWDDRNQLFKLPWASPALRGAARRNNRKVMFYNDLRSHCCSVTAFNMGSIKPRSPKFFIDMNINWKAKHWEPARLKRSSLVNVMIMSWCDAVVYRSNRLLWPICKDSYYFMTCSNSSPLVLLSPDHLFNLSFVNIKSLSVQYLYK